MWYVLFGLEMCFVLEFVALESKLVLSQEFTSVEHPDPPNTIYNHNDGCDDINTEKCLL